MTTELICPITWAEIEHPAFLANRYAFECSAIIAWLKHHSLTNPCTNEIIDIDWAGNILTGSDMESSAMIQQAGLLTGGRVD